jgi:hypothetical protein
VADGELPSVQELARVISATAIGAVTGDRVTEML